MSRLKVVFLVKWLRALARLVFFLIAILVNYLAQVFLQFVSIIARIVIIISLHYIGIYGQNINYCIVQLLVATII